MLQHVDVGERSLSAYRGIVPEAILAEVRKQARRLQGVRVLHLNATPYGGGVSELLRSLVPLLNDLGLKADWKVISGDDGFFRATKALHNGLQGAVDDLDEVERAAYRLTSERNARQLDEVRADAAVHGSARAESAPYDVIFVHDPQPAALLSLHGKGQARWIWRCHIDTSTPNPAVWEFFRPYLQGYDAAVFTMPQFVPPNLPIARVSTIAPAIDPLSPKNLRLPESTARQILDWIGIQLGRPLITQVARFDPWKDPLGVIAAYREVRREIPELQLALVGSMALDDPEGWEIYRQIQAESTADPLIHVFSNLTGVGNIEVNAFQRYSDVIVQKSLREGFGLVVSEALWKGTPVVAGRAGGIPLQMSAEPVSAEEAETHTSNPMEATTPGTVGGILVDSVEACAAGMRYLLQHPEEGEQLAVQGRERVRQHFLLPRLLLDDLVLISELLTAAEAGANTTGVAPIPSTPPLS
jgi:trehalose synthase